MWCTTWTGYPPPAPFSPTLALGPAVARHHCRKLPNQPIYIHSTLRADAWHTRNFKPTKPSSIGRPVRIDVRAQAEESRAEPSTSSIRDDHRERLLRTKQRIADLRAAQAAARAAAPAASQPPTPVSATTASDSRADANLSRSADRSQKTAESNSRFDSSQRQSAFNSITNRSEEAAIYPSFSAADRSATRESRGTQASQFSSKRPPVPFISSSADSSTMPAFPPKNPATKRRVAQSSSGTTEAQAFDHENASRARFLERLSDGARYAAHLESEAASQAAYLTSATKFMTSIEQQLAALLKRAGLAAGIGSGNGDCAACEFLQTPALTQQLARMQQATGQEVRKLQRQACIEVPVHYIGVANEVRMMGSFDNWSHGVRLFCRDESGDVFRRFEGRLLARQGEYLVKFVVDGKWKLSSGWPTREDASGGENNVLRID